MIDPRIMTLLDRVARFCDGRQVGDVGAFGFRRSTELGRVLPCLEHLLSKGVLVPGKTRFLDMGCADGRVNLFFSPLVGRSVGIELDDWILDEYSDLKAALETHLSRQGLHLPSNHVHLFLGDSMKEAIHDRIEEETGIAFEAFDLFYTYLTMQEEFASLIAKKARRGSVFAVYGLSNILPRFPGLRLLTPGRALNGVLALYEKE